MERAVFFDRDGVISKLVYNPKTQEYESANFPEEFALYPFALDFLFEIYQGDYLLFLVSNQPGFAKGKTTLENIRLIEEKFHQYVSGRKIKFTEYYYCYHHPGGIVREFSFDCACRKPKPYFIHKANEKYGLDLRNSWLVGDRDSDILCGQSCGLKTILIENDFSAKYQGKSFPDFRANDLREAAAIICANNDIKTLRR